MFAAVRYRLAQARLADEYCQAVRDAAMHPAIHYDLTRARWYTSAIRARRDALARGSR